MREKPRGKPVIPYSKSVPLPIPRENTEKNLLYIAFLSSTP